MSSRLFLCRQCGELVEICSRCDRGNAFCSSDCAAARRRESIREAAKRYQRTKRGAKKHKARQRRYRVRQLAVTHQSCASTRIRMARPPTASCSSLIPELTDDSPDSRRYRSACTICRRENETKLVRHCFLRSGEDPG